MVEHRGRVGGVIQQRIIAGGGGDARVRVVGGWHIESRGWRYGRGAQGQRGRG
jgi:hypothetical protein